MSAPNGPSLSRRSSLVNYISESIRLPSLRSRKSTASLKDSLRRQSSSHAPYSVHQQIMAPAILRDVDATAKLLECILESPGGRRSLSRLARTCKAFKDPVLDILWRDLDSFLPLVALFPTTLLKRARRPGLGLVRITSLLASSASYLMSNPIPTTPTEQTKAPERDDWTRVLAYGERVKSIVYGESAGNVSPSILPMLDESKPTQYILPNLEVLTWKVETAAALDRCRMFLGPRVKNVTLEVGTKSPKLNDVLAEIAAHRGLQSFAFTLHNNMPDNFTETFAGNVALEKVALTAPGALSPKVGKWAAGLPGLRTFAVDLSARSTTAVEGFFDDISPGSGYSTPSSVGGTDSGVYSGEELDFSQSRKSAVRLTRDGPRHGAFPILSNLTLTGECANIVMFLKHLTSPLAQLDLVMEDPPHHLDWHDLCTHITDQFPNTLQSLRITATTGSRFGELVRATSRGGDAPMRPLPLTWFSRLPRLNRLDIDLPESVIFTEKDIQHVARNCPSLEVLRLSPYARFPQTGPAPELTLESIIYLTKGCRRLHTIALVLNATEGSEATFGTREVCSRSLLRLQVGHSWMKDPLQTAVLLSHLAPHLETLKWFNEKNRAGAVEANAVAWARVNELLPHLQRLRLQERRLQPPPVILLPPPTADKGIDATPETIDQGVLARPQMLEASVQAEVELVDFGVQMVPETCSVEIDATPQFAHAGVSALPEVHDQGVDAIPETVDQATEIDLVSESDSSDDGSQAESVYLPTIYMFIPPIVPSAANGIMNLTFRVARFYTAPFRFMFSFMPNSLSRYANHSSISSSSSESDDSETKDIILEKRTSPSPEPAPSRANGVDLSQSISPVCQ